MNLSRLIERVRNVLMTPQTEWPAIAGETTSAPDLYKGYIAIIAAIPALAGFIKSSLIGYSMFGVTVRAPLSSGLIGMVVSYALGLALVYVVALIIDALAPTFGGQKNPLQALKAAAYSLTAGWIASIGLIVPWLGLLIALAGGIYSIYLLYLGLPATMKCPPQKAGSYTAVSVICAIVLNAVIVAVVSSITSPGAGGWSGGTGSRSTITSTTTTFDQSKAAEAVVNAALGGGDPVEALAPDQLKPFVPETLAGLKRSGFSAERNSAMGMQISEVQATYSDGAGHSLHLDISDMGGIKDLASLAGWVGVGSDKVTDHGYDKTYRQNGRLVHEQWDSQSGNGEFDVVVGERFSVKVSGHAGSIDELKLVAASLNLAGLEALKNQGVRKN